jgi:hypothetical protein
VARTTTTKLIEEQLPNLNNRKRHALKPKLVRFKEINALKRQLKPEETASNKKRKA